MDHWSIFLEFYNSLKFDYLNNENILNHLQVIPKELFLYKIKTEFTKLNQFSELLRIELLDLGQSSARLYQLL